MQRKIKNSILELVEGDITEMETDAIVNAANANLILGGGVADAIRRKGGPEIQKECNKIGGTFIGGAVKTTGGSLKAKYVIHAVGPRMGEGVLVKRSWDRFTLSMRLSREDRTAVGSPSLQYSFFEKFINGIVLPNQYTQR